MKYMGSKARHAKELLQIILSDRGPNQWYVEPFVGGANMIDKVGGNRTGADNNPYLIDMWQKVSGGWLPPENFSECQYNAIKINKGSYPQYLVGYVGFALSYGGKWFGGWCRDKAGKRDYVKESYNNALKQFPNLIGVKFECSNYNSLNIPENSIIYCDPPYKNTTGYVGSFDHEQFYNWCRNMVKCGHTIYVSEYNMPDDFICVWEKSVNSSLTSDTGGKKSVEKLFTLK